MRFRQGHIFGESRKSTDIFKLVRGEFDAGLFSPSWDHRSDLVTSCDALSVRFALVLNFTTKDEFGHQLQHRKSLSEFLTSHAGEVKEVIGDSIRIQSLWLELWGSFQLIAHQVGRPLRLFVDLSTCPRYLALGLIAGALRTGIASSITVLYAEGEYTPSVALPALSDYSFSVGQWQTVVVPFLEGQINPRRPRMFIVSLGFEAAKTSRVLATQDPHRVCMLYPIPGVIPTYTDEVLKRNEPLLERFQVCEKDILYSHASDAIAAWKALDTSRLEDFSAEDIYYLCCGPKPHALAFALRAICLGRPAVLYNIPERHSFVNVVPTGTYWRFDINDNSALPH
jgi:hypothetical protein